MISNYCIYSVRTCVHVMENIKLVYKPNGAGNANEFRQFSMNHDQMMMVSQGGCCSQHL